MNRIDVSNWKLIITHVGQLDFEEDDVSLLFTGSFFISSEQGSQFHLVIQICLDIFIFQSFQQILSAGHTQRCLVQLQHQQITLQKNQSTVLTSRFFKFTSIVRKVEFFKSAVIEKSMKQSTEQPTLRNLQIISYQTNDSSSQSSPTTTGQPPKPSSTSFSGCRPFSSARANQFQQF